jgi:WD40 repeat protein
MVLSHWRTLQRQSTLITELPPSLLYHCANMRRFLWRRKRLSKSVTQEPPENPGPELPIAIFVNILSFLDRGSYNQICQVSKEVHAISRQVLPPWPGAGRRIRQGRQLVTCVALSPDDTMLAVAAKEIHVWNQRCGKVKTIGTPRTTLALAFSPNGKWLLSAGIDDCITIWNLPEYSLHQRLERCDEITHITVSPDNTHLASWGYDGLIRVWKIISDDDSVRQVGETDLKGYDTVTLGNSGDLAWAVDKHTIRIQKVNDSQQFTDLHVAHRITLVRYIPNGIWLLVGFGNGTIHFYNVVDHSWSSRSVLVEKDCYVTCVSFSSEKLAIGCGAKIFIYSYQAGDDLCLLRTLKGHRDRVESVSFASNGRNLVSGGDKSIIFWNV